MKSSVTSDARGSTHELMDRAAPVGDDVGAMRLRAALRNRLLDIDERVHVGRYELGDRLGVGGMGVVHRGWDPELERSVAIKFVPLAGLSPDVVLREARAMASVVHRNVVPVYDVGRRDTEAYLVMAFMEGGTLVDWLDDGLHSPALRLAKLLEAGRGIAAAHAAGIVHHDFKPSNVLLDEAGRACVSDFGLSSVVRGAASMSTLDDSDDRGHSHRGGTPGYSAPERVTGAVGDVRSDQYSYCVTVAMTLAQCVDVQPKPEAAREIAHRLCDAPPDGVDVEVGRALLRGLSTLPDERYRSMEALLEAMCPTAPPRWRRWGIALAGLAVLGGVGLAGYAPPTVSRVDPPQIDDAQLPPSADHHGSAQGALLRLSEQARGTDQIDVAERYAAAAWLLGIPEDNRTAAELMMEIGFVALERSRSKEARDRLTTALGHAQAARWDEGIAAIHVGLIRTLEKGDSEEAREHERFARAALSRMAPANHRIEFNLELAIGTAELTDANLDRAEAAARRGIAVGEAHGITGSYWAYFDLAQVLSRRHAHEDGQAACQRALDIAESEGASMRDLLILRSSLKNFATYRGNLSAAREQSEVLLPLFEAHYGPHDERTVETIFNLAMLRGSTGDFDGAFELYERAITTLQRWHPDDLTMLARTYGGLAQAKGMQGDLDQAEIWYSKALVEVESAGSGDDPTTVKWRAQLGGIEMERGHLVAATRHLTLAIEAADRIGDAARPGQATALAYRGRIHADAGRLDAARTDLLRSIEAGVGTLDALHPEQAWEARVLAEVEAARGDLPAARAVLEAVLSGLEKGGLHNGRTWAASAFELAALIAKDGIDPSRARQLVQRARAAYVELPATTAEVEELDLWLARH